MELATLVGEATLSSGDVTSSSGMTTHKGGFGEEDVVWTGGLFAYRFPKKSFLQFRLAHLQEHREVLQLELEVHWQHGIGALVGAKEEAGLWDGACPASCW